MNEGLIPNRYAKALLKFAAELGATERVYQLMLTLSASFSAEPGLSAAVRNPFVADSDKVSLLTTAAGAVDSDTCFADFLSLLVKKRRVSFAREIALAFCSIYRKANGISVVEVTTAYPVGDDERERLKALVAKNVGTSKLEIAFNVVPDIIGGFVVTIDSRRLDASITNQLKQLRQQLISK
ncbi:MAG: F0F1 ATP synthase subunit delta [Muribaculaceae bacterium]|nr:F0F1 ATP synthase subunit delta [Muribaculaceae bacterium]MBQ7211384.1 F0F1 ATP synthase subunit delta [Muribaculaceae bacterium]